VSETSPNPCLSSAIVLFVKTIRNGVAIRQLADGVQAVKRSVVFKRAFYGLDFLLLFRQWKKKGKKKSLNMTDVLFTGQSPL